MLLYELPNFEHRDVENVKEAVSWLHKYGEKARVIAGGTDLLGVMKDRVKGPQLRIPDVLINIKPIPEINKITYDEGAGLKVGAAVTLNRVETSDIIKQRFSVLSQAAGQVGTTQIRNMGTIGGNICQRPRCMYFRHPHFLCLKKGGPKCYATTGEHRYYYSILKNGKCVMAHPSDIAPALVALKANVVIAGYNGEKEMPLHDFFSPANNFTETVLKPDEFLTEFQVPNQKGKTYQLFLKHRIRHSSDFSLVSVAAVAQISDEICQDIKIVLGGIAPFPSVASKAEEMVKERRLNERLISEAAEASVERARPLPMNQYKVHLAKALVRRVLTLICRASARA